MKPLNIKFDRTKENTNYYVLINIKKVTTNFYGEKGLQVLINNYNYLDFLITLAYKYKVILLPGSGFRTQPWFIRVSLSNLHYRNYSIIAERIKYCIKFLIDSVKSNKTKKNVN